MNLNNTGKINLQNNTSSYSQSKSPNKSSLNHSKLNDSNNKHSRYEFAHRNRTEEIFNDDHEEQEEADDSNQLVEELQYDRDDFDEDDDEEDYPHNDINPKSKDSTLNDKEQEIYNQQLYNTNKSSKPPKFGGNTSQNNISSVNQQQQSDNNNIYGNAGLQPNSNQTSLHNTSKNNYFNVSNDGVNQRFMGSAGKTKERLTPTLQQKVTVLDAQFRPYYLNSTYNRSASKNNRKKVAADTSATQIYENNQGQLLIANKVIRFTENGIKQGTSTQRQQLANLNKQRKANDLIQNYITSVHIQPNQYIPSENRSTINANSNALKPLMHQPDMKLQRELSAPKGIGTAAPSGGKRVRQYNKILMDFQDKYYRKKIRPNHIMVSAEELYDENMQLKYKINQQDQFILMQKTQNKLLNNELEKQQQLLKQLIQASSIKNEQNQQATVIGQNQYSNQQNQHEILLMNLKRELDIALKTLSVKESEIKSLQKQGRVTKFREVDEERKAYMQESFRLHKIIQNMITRGMGRNGKALSSHRSSTKPEQEQLQNVQNQHEQQMQEEFMQRIQQYSNIIEQLQQQLTDSNKATAQLQQDNQQLQQLKDDSQHQQNLLTAQVQKLQQQKHEVELQILNLENELLESQNQRQDNALQSQLLQQQVDSQEQLKQLQGKYERLMNDNDKIKQENQKLQQDIVSAESRIMDLDKLIEQKDMLNQQEVIVLNNQINNQNHLINELRELIQSLEEQLQEAIQQATAAADANNLNLDNYDDDLKGTTNSNINMPKSLSPSELQQQLPQSLDQQAIIHEEDQQNDVIEDDYVNTFEDAKDISGIQDNYGTMEITKKSKLSLNQLQQQQQEYTQQVKILEEQLQENKDKLDQKDQEIRDLLQQLQYKDEVTKHIEEKTEEYKLELQQLAQKLSQQEQEFQEEFDSKMKELTEQIEAKDNEINEQKQLIEGDIKQRLKRCLTILQIRDISDLEKFFMSNIPIQQDFSPIDMIIMRFNFTQYESLVIIEDLLKLNPKQCELPQLIENLVSTFIPLDIPSDEEMLENFKQLQAKLSDQSLTVELFMGHHGYDELQMIHYLSVTKTLQLYLPDNYQINSMVLYLLNQSKNFTQIDVNVLRRCMNLQGTNANGTARFNTGTQRSIRRNNSASDLNKGTPPNKKHIGEHRLSMNVSINEIKDPLTEKKDTDLQLRLALDDIKGKLLRKNSGDIGGDDGDDGEDGTSELMQLNMNANLAFSDRSGISAATKSVNNFAIQQKQMKFMKNVQLQLIAQALNAKFINLRNKLRIYHTDQIEHILGVEVEVIKLPDFFDLLKKLKVLQYEDNTEEDLQSQDMIEDMLIQLESVYTIESLDQKVIILNKLVMGLQAFGYQDHQLPKSKKGLHFDELDVKSIRIMNRIVQHVQKEVIEFLKKFNINIQALNKQQMHQIYTQIMESIVFKDCLNKVLLKARNKEEKCFLMNQETFYKRLKELGIKRSASEYENLNRFLWIDIQFPQYILFKKLIKAIEIIQSNPYCKAIGLKKVSLEDQTIIVKSNSQYNSRQNLSSFDGKSRQSRIMMNNKPQKSQDVVNVNNDDNSGNDDNDNEEYEESYYDEESKIQDQIKEVQSQYEETLDQF